MENDYKAAVNLLRQGQAPGNRLVLDEITVGVQPLVNFLKEQYLRDYIALGGSKIKFVTGKKGSGKTHFLELLSYAAADTGFVTVSFSAKEVWLHDFREMYAEIFSRCDLMDCLNKIAARIISELGYDCKDVAEGTTFADYLSGIGEFDALTKKEIRNQLQSIFLKNPLIDNNFAIACSLLTGGILGHPALEASNRELLLKWLSGGKDTKIAQLRRLGLSPAKITKYNARHMLRSLTEIHRLASFSGLLVIIDDADILVNATSMDTIRYTKLKREDTYESMRELIDEIDTLQNIMFVYAFDKRLIEDEACGLKSYQALWLRIQNEIVSDQFNQFSDIIDLDVLGKRIYTKDSILQMSERIAGVVNSASHGAAAINTGQADELLADSQFTDVALPRRVGQATLNGEAHTDDRF